MTDTIVDDDIIDVPTTTRSSSSASSISTSRRPMVIETEIRTDTVTTRRMASAAANRSLHDVLENTKSPNDGRAPTSYTYAHSTAYAPVTRTGSYDTPAMARRNLHGGRLSTDNSESLPTQLLSNVRSQISEGYTAIRDRISQLAHHENGSSPSRSTTNAGTRYSRTSSQSSATGGRSSGYNLRSRPVHSTPRDFDGEPTRKGSGLYRKDQQHGEIDEEDDNEHDDEYDDGNRRHKYNARQTQHSFSDGLNQIFRSFVDMFDSFWNVLKSLPWWLLIPLLLLFGLFTLPTLICKPFEFFPSSPMNDLCQHVHRHVGHATKDTYDFTRRHTFERGMKNLKDVYRSAIDIKDSISSSLADIFQSTRKSFPESVSDATHRVKEAVGSTSDNAKDYCEAGLGKMNKLIADFRSERDKFLGARHTFTPDQEKEFTTMIRKYIDEYGADETGQADFALEANGGQIVDTRCHEYTDEPRQNVVKFLGIPIVHMSKHPDIIIKHGRMPGQCFPFKGDHGSIVIRLAVPVVPTEFVLEHLSKSISVVGHINSAPNNFTVYALKDKHDKEGVVLGRYYYDAENGPALQRFKPQIGQPRLVEYIELQITSNWGNPSYTCIYRFRVHGDIQTVVPSAPPGS